MNYKVDIRKLLNDMAGGKMSAIDKLSEEELKSVSPYVLQMWIKGADSNVNYRMVYTNAFANHYMFALGHHPKLLYKLLCYANDLNESTRFYFQKRTKAKSTNFTVGTLMKFYEMDERHAIDIMPILTSHEVLEIGKQLGYDKDEMKKLKNENK